MARYADDPRRYSAWPRVAEVVTGSAQEVPPHDHEHRSASATRQVRRRVAGARSGVHRGHPAEPGNICFDWFRSVEDPNVYLLVEMFRDRAAGDAHVNSDHFKAAMGQMGHAYAGMPEVVHVEVPGEGWSAMAEVQRATETE